jgi:2'-5' RNA ligase
MRAFIAVPLSDGVRNALVRVQRKLEQSGTRMKLVEPENLHVTMKFLGGIDDSRVKGWRSVLDKIETKPFEMKFDHLGVFPGMNFIKVVWAGVENEEMIKKVHDVIGPEDEKWVAHVTLARVKGKPTDKFMEVLKESDLNEKQLADKVQLMKSELTPEGPVYSKIYEVDLK